MSETAFHCNLLKGHPSNRLLARSEVLEGSISTLQAETRPGDADNQERHPLAYGSDSGARSAREAIGFWQASSLKEEIPEDLADHINLTNGASFGALNAILSVTSPTITQRIFVVSPTYFLINGIFEDAGFRGKLTSVVETENGLDLEGLEKELTKYGASSSRSIENGRKYRFVMYLVPTFSNPRGGIISRDQRVQLLELARKYDMLLLCDDCYDLLSYDHSVLPPRLVYLDRQTLPKDDKFGHVISNCTFSKILGPGLRVGWQEAATSALGIQLSQTGWVKSGGTPAHLNTFVVKSTIQTGSVDQVIRRLKDTFEERSKALIEALKDNLPPGTTIEGGQGGYFLWVTLPKRFSSFSKQIVERAKSKNLILAPGTMFEVNGDLKNWNSSYRVCFAYEEVASLQKAAVVWASVLSEFDGVKEMGKI